MLVAATGAIAHYAITPRRLLPATKVLAGFPDHLGTYSAQQQDFPDSALTRRAYAPAVIVYRNYSNGRNEPINLFIAPEPVGNDSPSICAPYLGEVVTQRSVLRVPKIAGLLLTQIVSRPHVGRAVKVCAYYWRTSEGAIDEGALSLLKGKLAVALRAGKPAFRVDMCTTANDVQQSEEASQRLREFAEIVDPIVQLLLIEAESKSP